MIFKPRPLSAELPAAELETDKAGCEKFGSCGIGDRAIYLSSYFVDRRYYIPFTSVQRVYKRLAMSKGGFTGKGIFASIPYLVVEYDGGREKQCMFRNEKEVDQLLDCLQRKHPEIKRVSAAAEARLAKRAAERAARKQAELSPQARQSLDVLRAAEAYLEKRPDLFLELSQAARQKRAFLRSKPSYRWAALAITGLGAVALGYGIFLFARGGEFALWFTLLGLAVIFLFSGSSVLPTARNNKAAVMGRADKAKKAMENYVEGYSSFPVPARYAHPAVLRRMEGAIEEGRAEEVPQALEVIKKDLKALNSDVEVDQEEYDEVVAIKHMFLNEDYR